VDFFADMQHKYRQLAKEEVMKILNKE
jgi:hypothetical protein